MIGKYQPILHTSIPFKTPAELKCWGHCPPKVSNFIDRPEVTKKLEVAFEQADDSQVVLSALGGLGGIGKTQLAASYFQSEVIKSRYIFRAWFNAENCAQLKSEYIQLAQKAGIFNERDSEIDNIARVKDWLNEQANEQSKRKWFLIYDNVNASDVEAIKDYIPSAGGDILITSRKITFTNPRVIAVPLFTVEEAERFLLKQSDCQREPALTGLVEELGRLPLALAQAGAYIKSMVSSMSYDSTPITKYFLEYQEQKIKFLQRNKELRQNDFTEKHESVYVTFNMSFQKLEKQSTDALRLLYCCGLLASEAIPVEVLSAPSKAWSILQVKVLS